VNHPGRRPGRGSARSGGLILLAAGLVTGCTRESTRLAIETQRRADEIQQAVFEQQHQALRVLLYRDLLRRLNEGGRELSDAQQVAAGEVWNDRDLIEFWAVQNERARALRTVGVDAKLVGDQSVVDLLYKSIAARGDRIRQALAAEAGRQAADQARE